MIQLERYEKFFEDIKELYNRYELCIQDWALRWPEPNKMLEENYNPKGFLVTHPNNLVVFKDWLETEWDKENTLEEVIDRSTEEMNNSDRYTNFYLEFADILIKYDFDKSKNSGMPWLVTESDLAPLPIEGISENIRTGYYHRLSNGPHPELIEWLSQKWMRNNEIL